MHFLCIAIILNSITTDRPTDGQTDRRTDKASYRDAWTHLKISVLPIPSQSARANEIDFQHWWRAKLQLATKCNRYSRLLGGLAMLSPDLMAMANAKQDIPGDSFLPSVSLIYFLQAFSHFVALPTPFKAAFSSISKSLCLVIMLWLYRIFFL